MTSRPLTLAATLPLTLMIALASCGQKSGAASTLVYQESADIPTLDPGNTYDTGSGQVVENLYEPLLDYKGSSLQDLEGRLATGWNLAEDGKSLTFKLRDGVKFHSGNTFSCADAEYTLRRNLVTNSSSSGNWFLSEALLGTGSNAKDDPSITWARIAAAVRCSDNSTLVLTLPKPDPAILAKLAYIGQGIVDKKHAAEVGEWDGTEATWKKWVGQDLTGSKLSASPSGTGAYKLVSRDANTLLTEAFPGYWGDKPTIQKVVIQKVPEDAARVQAFLKGDADVIETGGRPVIKEQLEGKPGVTVLDDLPNTASSAIFMNQKIAGTELIGSGKLDGKGVPANFFSDVNVRRAFNYAFDVQTYIRDVQLNKGKPRTMLLPDTFPGYDANIPTYTLDRDKAVAAFKSAWGGQVWQNGFVLNADYRAGSVPAQTAMEILKKNVEALNPKFKVNLTAKQWSSMIKDSNEGKEVMILQAWAPDYADPDNFMYTFYSSKGYYKPSSNFVDPTIDRDLEQARTITDMDERSKLYAEVGQRAHDQAYFITMPAAAAIITYRDSVAGVSAETYNPMRSFILGTYWRNLSKK